jgi:hypothetical protein
MRHHIDNRGVIGWKIPNYVVAKAVEIKRVYLIANYKGVRSNYYRASAGSIHNKEQVGTSVAQSPSKRCLRLSCQGHMQKEDNIGQLEPFDLLPRLSRSQSTSLAYRLQIECVRLIEFGT